MKRSPPPSARQAEFLRFCSRALGTSRKHPLHAAEGGAYIPGATIGALVDAFKELEPRPKEPEFRIAEAYDSPVFKEPFAVYSIRNTVTGACYIGRAVSGFVKRYYKGEWWDGHHNKRLMKDVEMYGVLSFRVAIWACPDEKEMARLEAELVRAHRSFTYNERVEPDNA